MNETRFAPLNDIELRYEDEGNGFIRGYGSVKGLIDSYGSIMFSSENACYADLDGLLSKGSLVDTHHAATNFIPTILGGHGIFRDVAEDSYGLKMDAEFCPDEKAQTIRSRVKFRKDNQKSTGLSIGFLTLESFYIYPKDYASELPKYSNPQYLSYNLQKAKQFSRIEIKTKIKPYETSITDMPSNEASVISEVRSELRSNHLGAYKNSVTINAIWVLINALGYDKLYTLCLDNTRSVEERKSEWMETCDEFRDFSAEIFTVVESLSSEEGEEIRSLFLNPELLNANNGNSITDKMHSEVVLQGIRSYAERAAKRAERLESRVGKKISKENWSKIDTACNELDASLSNAISQKDTLRSLLDETNPTVEETRTIDYSVKINEVKLRIQKRKLNQI